ncbi:MAG: 30S ribosomal protein S6 [bacterium]
MSAIVRLYESMFIIDPSLEEGERNAITEKIKNVITANGGEIVQVDIWGNRTLAYEVKKRTEGFYVLLYFRADGGLVGELERNYKVTDGVLRYLTVLSTGPKEIARGEETAPSPDEKASVKSDEDEKIMEEGSGETMEIEEEEEEDDTQSS